MEKLLLIALAAVAACGGRTPAGANLPEGMGGIRVAMHTTTLPGTVMGEIIIQNVFDASQTQVVQCTAKPETLNGLVFCDELSVLPPGVYEVKFESQTGCQMTQDHYKVVVQAGLTTEVQINLVCDASAGGLDVIVTENHAPQIDKLTFTFAVSGAPANKYMCANGPELNVTFTVEDAETPCDQLTTQWSVNGVYFSPFDNPIAPVVAVRPVPYFVDPVNNVCEVNELIEPGTVPPGTYSLDLAISDGTLTTKFAYPIHIIECPER